MKCPGHHPRPFLLLAPLALWLALACRSTETRGPRPLAEATLFHGGTIYLGAPEWRRVDAVLVHAGRVVAAGDPVQLEGMARARGLRRVDLEGGVALPGLQDAHAHWEGYGAALEVVDLRGAASYAEVVARVAERAASEPAGSWIEGRGWDQNLWASPEFPHHAALSAAVPEHPVFLERVDGHAVLVNALALEQAGLDGAGLQAEPLPGGRLLLDAEGRATGVLIDAAAGLVELPAPDEATRVRRILRAQQALLAAGLTAVHDMGVTLEGLALMRRLSAEGRLDLRGVLYLSDPGQITPAMIAARSGAREREDGALAVVGVKLYADGALGSRGAALLEDYADAPGEQGLLQLTERELAERVALCAAAGLQPAVHAIGDRGVRLVLDVFAARLAADPGFAELRPRVEHAQVVAPSDRGRFAALGVVPSMQPVHCTSDMPWAPARLGAARVAGAYAWRRLAPDPAALAFGSDCPVEDPSPLLGAYAAATRRTPSGEPPAGFPDLDQRLTVREALAAYTTGAARAARQEAQRGRLEPGYHADLTVLDRDPFAGPPEELLRARVLMTVVAGRVVHEAGQDRE